MEMPEILVYGYGNPGRQDDGLGIALVERLKNDNLHSNIEFDVNYQLNVEDALTISTKDIVIFIDASSLNIDCFRFQKIIPSAANDFTTHAMHPSCVMEICRKLYDKSPDAYILEIKGYKWDMKEILSQEAQRNLELAYRFMKNKLSVFGKGCFGYSCKI
ncbi:hydrogenase maturation protease [Elusimicrobiota bacterium]